MNLVTKYIIDFAFKFDFIKQKYLDSIDRELDQTKTEIIEKWKDYTYHLKLLNSGLSCDEIIEIINKYNKLVELNVNDKEFSGTIYTNVTDVNYDYEKTLVGIYGYIYKLTFWWNPLHVDEFMIGNIINYQLSSMVINMLGGDINKSIGIFTTGGTQSIMNAARCYLKYGKQFRNLKRR